MRSLMPLRLAISAPSFPRRCASRSSGFAPHRRSKSYSHIATVHHHEVQHRSSTSTDQKPASLTSTSTYLRQHQVPSTRHFYRRVQRKLLSGSLPATQVAIFSFPVV